MGGRPRRFGGAHRGKGIWKRSTSSWRTRRSEIIAVPVSIDCAVDSLSRIKAILASPDFPQNNPNRLRALAGSFSVNQWIFHIADGRGYRFLADLILAAEAINPQVAARLVPPLGRWRRFDEHRAALMRAELERIVAVPGLSKDVFEQASKSLS